MKNKNVLYLAFNQLIKRAVFIFILVFLSFTYSQKKQKFYIPDSLKNKSYSELYGLQNKYSLGSVKSKIFANAYLHKAKNENDTIKIANGFSQLASIYSLSDFSVSLKYSDSIILLTKNMINPIYPGFGYMVKGMCLATIGKYEGALDNYLLAHKFASENKNLKQLFYLKNRIGQLKYFWGNYSEAAEIYKTQLGILKDSKTFNSEEKEELLLNVYFHLSNIYILNKNPDSAMIYVDLGIQKSKNSNNKYNFISQSGIIAYYQKNYQTALDSLDKAFPFETSTNALFNQHYYRGLIYSDLNSDEKAF